MASAKPARNAAVFNTGLINANKAENAGILAGATDTGYLALDAGRNSAERALQDSSGRSIAELDRYYGTARDDLNTGFDQARGDVNSSIDVFRPAYDAGNRAMTLRGNFLGTGEDPQAAADALATFRNSTGYRDMEAEARDGYLRSQNVIGMLGGGNTVDGVTRLSSSLADRSAQQWLTNLGQDADRGMTAANGMASGYRSLADLATQRGAGLSNLAMTQGARTADVIGGTGRSIADLYLNDAGQRVNLATGLGNALVGNNTQATNAITGQVTDQANSSMAAKNANQNLALGIAGMGVKLLSGGKIPSFGGASA